MKKIYLLFLIGMVNLLEGQESKIKFPSTPEIEKFGRNIDYPIDLNTGGVSYNVPLFNITFNNLSLNFNLNYSSHGVKVGDLSYEFGHDWSLNIPKISREVRGIPDEFGFGYLYPQEGYSTQDMADKAFRNNPNDPTQHPDNDISFQNDIYERAHNGEYDLQADKFYFNINGKSGYFMFKDKSHKIITYPFQDLKIYPDLPNSIKIIDTDGTEYHFGNDLSAIESNYKGFNTSWYATKIVNNNNIINFEYDNIRTSYSSFIDQYETVYRSDANYENDIPSDKIITIDIIFKPIIRNINYKNFDVNFTYSESNTFTGIKKIDKINVLKDKKEAYSYLFKISNYTPYHDMGYESGRIFLDKILLETDKKIEDYYSFSYYNPSNLPSRFSNKQDLWGFYNGYSNSSIIPSYSINGSNYKKSDRSVNSDLLNTGILNKIILPTKGYIQIETEPNEIRREFLKNLVIGNTRLGPIILEGIEDEDSYYFKTIASVITSFSNPDIEHPDFYEEKFTLEEDKNVIFWVWDPCNFITPSSDCPSAYLIGDEQSIILLSSDNKKKFKLKKGNYTLIAYPAYTNSIENPRSQDIGVTIVEEKLKEHRKNIFANGLRIKSISHYDNNQKLILKKSYNYNKDNDISSGDFINLGFLTRNHFPSTGNGIYFTRLHSFFKKINNFDGIHYNYVTEITEDVKNKLTNKSVYNYYRPLEVTFSPKSDVPLQQIVNFMRVPTPPIIFPYVPNWRLNSLKSKLDFKDDILIKEVSNDYTFTYNLRDGKYDYNFNIDQSMGMYVPLVSQSPSEQMYLSKTTTTEYFENKEPIVTEINYNYDSQNHLQLTKQTTTNSKGETLTTEYQYPPDWKDNPIAQRLTAENRIAEPLTVVQKNSSNNVISAVYNEYNDFNGILQKSRVFQKKGNDKFAEGDDVITYNSYDNKGNITQYTPENGIPVSIIWGYNGQYPVAKIEGLAYNDLMNSTNYTSNIINAIIYQTTVPNNRDFVANLLMQLRVNDFCKDAMVTGYIYKPLVGVAEIIQPNGQTEYYNYDDANRLQEIKNDKGEVLKTFEYNYKP